LESPETETKGSLARNSHLEPHSEVVAQQKEKNCWRWIEEEARGEEEIFPIFFSKASGAADSPEAQ
jgi:hypothetical protein